MAILQIDVMHRVNISKKRKLMLTDYFSSYKINNKITPFFNENKSPKLKDCLFNVIKVLQHLCNGVY